MFQHVPGIGLSLLRALATFVRIVAMFCDCARRPPSDRSR